MVWQLAWCFDLYVLALVWLQVDGVSEYLFEIKNGYTDAMILENFTSSSLIHCTANCSSSTECVAADFEELQSSCITVNDVSQTEDGRPKYVKVASKKAEFGNSSYFLTFMEYEARSCSTVCERYGGYLSTIASETENTFVTGFIQKGRTCIGGRKPAGSTNYTWLNGEDWTYTNWSPYNTPIPSGEEGYITYWDDTVDAWDKWVEMSSTEMMRCLCEQDVA